MGVVKKKTEIEIDEDLLRRAKEAAEEEGMNFTKFIEDAIYTRLSKHHTWKARLKTPLTEREIQKRKSAVEKSWGFMPVDREIVEAALREPGYLDV